MLIDFYVEQNKTKDGKPRQVRVHLRARLELKKRFGKQKANCKPFECKMLVVRILAGAVEGFFNKKQKRHRSEEQCRFYISFKYLGRFTRDGIARAK